MEKTVLVVEDNPDEAFIIKRALAKGSIHVNTIVFNSGDEVVNYLFPVAGSNKLPDLILLDLKLYGMSGFDVLRKIKSSNRTHFIPVVIHSSSELPQDRIEAFSSGASSFIRKPISFSELAKHMDLMLQYWLTLNQSVT